MKRLLLINSIVWAGLILLASALFKDSPNYQYFFGFLLIAFSFLHGVFSRYAKKHNTTSQTCK